MKTLICVFPAELVLEILLYSDPRDIVRWRTVSNWFRTITHNDLLWTTLYTSSSLPRPPGPSPHQSSAYLDRALVKSAQLAHSWTTRPMREVGSMNIQLGQPLGTTPHKLILGRWVVGCEDARRFVLHDGDGRAKTYVPKKVLWEHKEPVVSAWDVHAVSPVGGLSIVYVLLEFPKTKQPPVKWKLLEFQLHDESGEIYGSAIIDPPAWARSSLCRVKLRGGHLRFLCILTETPDGVVFDTQTRTFYRFPKFYAVLDGLGPTDLNRRIGNSGQDDPWIEFADTLIIFLCHHRSSVYRGLFGNGTLIQIFVVPSDGASEQDGAPLLRLIHEGFSEDHLSKVSVTKPSVDPITGETSIRLLDHYAYLSSFSILVVDLTLPMPSDDSITAMGVNDKRMIEIPTRDISFHRYADTPRCLCLDVCDSRQLRGFLRNKPMQKLYETADNQHVMKFAMDMTQELEVVENSQMSAAEWRDAADARMDWTRQKQSISFDGLRGRLCYVHPRVKDQVVVVEIE